MIAALKVWWRAMRHYNHYGYRYIWTNAAWLLLTLPVLTAPAAWAAFVTVSHSLYNGQIAGLNEFWAAFRQNLLRGVGMAVINIAVVGITINNLTSYSQNESPVFVVIRTTWLLTLAGWFMAQIYLYPLMLEMEKPTIRGGLRNALAMMFLNPGFTITLFVTYLLVFALGYTFIVLWMLVIGGIMVSVSTGAVLDRLVAAGLRPALPDPTDTPEVNDMNIT